MYNRKSVAWLLSGLAAVAFAVGYMAGGSRTPVVATLVPAVAGLVVTALGLLGANPLKRAAASLKAREAQPPGEEDERILARLKEEVAVARELVGKGMVVFVTAYLPGMLLGSLARVNGWMLFERTSPLSEAWGWNEQNSITDLELALDWILLRQQLGDLGCTDDEIAALFQAVRASATSGGAIPVSARSPGNGGPVAEVSDQGSSSAPTEIAQAPEGSEPSPEGEPGPGDDAPSENGNDGASTRRPPDLSEKTKRLADMIDRRREKLGDISPLQKTGEDAAPGDWEGVLENVLTQPGVDVEGAFRLLEFHQVLGLGRDEFLNVVPGMQLDVSLLPVQPGVPVFGQVHFDPGRAGGGEPAVLIHDAYRAQKLHAIKGTLNRLQETRIHD